MSDKGEHRPCADTYLCSMCTLKTRTDWIRNTNLKKCFPKDQKLSVAVKMRSGKLGISACRWQCYVIVLKVWAFQQSFHFIPLSRITLAFKNSIIFVPSLHTWGLHPGLAHLNLAAALQVPDKLKQWRLSLTQSLHCDIVIQIMKFQIIKAVPEIPSIFLISLFFAIYYIMNIFYPELPSTGTHTSWISSFFRVVSPCWSSTIARCEKDQKTLCMNPKQYLICLFQWDFFCLVR